MTDPKSRVQLALLLADLLPYEKPGDPATPGWGGVEADQLAEQLMGGGLSTMAIALANVLLRLVDIAEFEAKPEPGKNLGLAREAIRQRDEAQAELTRIKAELTNSEASRTHYFDQSVERGVALSDAERTIAELKTDLAWERGWDVCRKAQMGAVVEAARAFLNTPRNKDDDPMWRLVDALSALDAPSQTEPASEQCAGCDQPTGYCAENCPVRPRDDPATPPELPDTSVEAPREIRVGSTVRCDFGNGQRITGKVVRKDSSDIPYLVEYTATEAVVLQTWADPRSTTWLSDPPEQPREIKLHSTWRRESDGEVGTIWRVYPDGSKVSWQDSRGFGDPYEVAVFRERFEWVSDASLAREVRGDSSSGSNNGT